MIIRLFRALQCNHMMLLDNPGQMHKFETVNRNCTNKKVVIFQGL